jgi:hypothetical protein
MLFHEDPHLLAVVGESLDAGEDHNTIARFRGRVAAIR